MIEQLGRTQVSVGSDPEALREAIDAALDQVRTAATRRVDLEARIADLEETVGLLRADADRRAELDQENARLAEHVEQARAALARACSETERLRRQLRERDRVIGEMQAGTVETAAGRILARERDDALDELEKALVAAERLESTVAERDASIVRLEQELLAAWETMEETEAQQRETEKAADELVEEANRRVGAAQEYASALEQDAIRLENALAGERAAGVATSAQLRQLAAERDGALQDAARAHARAVTAEAIRSEAEATIRDLQRKLSRGTATRSARAEPPDRPDEVRELRSEVTRLRAFEERTVRTLRALLGEAENSEAFAASGPQNSAGSPKVTIPDVPPSDSPTPDSVTLAVPATPDGRATAAGNASPAVEPAPEGSDAPTAVDAADSRSGADDAGAGRQAEHIPSEHEMLRGFIADLIEPPSDYIGADLCRETARLLKLRDPELRVAEALRRMPLSQRTSRVRKFFVGVLVAKVRGLDASLGRPIEDTLRAGITVGEGAIETGPWSVELHGCEVVERNEGRFAVLHLRVTNTDDRLHATHPATVWLVKDDRSGYAWSPLASAWTDLACCQECAGSLLSVVLGRGETRTGHLVYPLPADSSPRFWGLRDEARFEVRLLHSG